MTHHGYGLVFLDKSKRKMMAHRRSWEIANGPIPDGMCILHRCDNPKCFNIDHLFMGTRIDNNLDKKNKGRGKGTNLGKVGEETNHSKLTFDDVNEIRTAHLFGARQAHLAHLFGVTVGAIAHIVHGRQWVS